MYHHLYNISVTGLRFFTVYGPWGRPDMAAFSFAHRMSKGLPITVYGHGKPRRDFTYIDDIISGVVGAMALGTASDALRTAGLPFLTGATAHARRSSARNI